MENQPTEILEHFFKQFSSLKDLRKCFNTCTRWKKIIEEMTKNSAKVLVAGGHEKGEKFRSSFVIIDLLDPKKHDVFLDERLKKFQLCNLMGGVLKNQPILCGFDTKTVLDQELDDYMMIDLDILDRTPHVEDNLESIVLGDPEIALPSIRGESRQSMVMLNQDTFWITGGKSSPSSFCEICWQRRWRSCTCAGLLKSSKSFLSLDQSELKEEPSDLPFGVNSIFGHCMIKVDSKTIYVIGGSMKSEYGYFKTTKKTWIVDPTNNFQVIEGPELNYARNDHSVALIKIGGRKFLAVVGGIGHRHWDIDDPIINPDLYDPAWDVELLDLSSAEQAWILGPQIPYHKVIGFTVITSPSGSLVLLGGTEWGKREVNGFCHCDQCEKNETKVYLTDGWEHFHHFPLKNGSTIYSSRPSRALLELSGDSLESLKWTLLDDQILQFQRVDHVSFPITKYTYQNLIEKLKMKKFKEEQSAIQNEKWRQKCQKNHERKEQQKKNFKRNSSKTNNFRRGLPRSGQGSFRGNRRGRGGGFRQNQILKETLDAELDSYMAVTRTVLDQELDNYMSQGVANKF